MKFEDWEPFYEAILKDFGYSRREDIRAASFLNRRLEPFDARRIDELVRGEDVVVVGNAPSLKPADVTDISHVVVAADGAAERLYNAGIDADIIVTDLDGSPRHAAEASNSDTVVAVHAHGDNTDALRRWLGRFSTGNVLGTTQTRAFGVMQNFGGFTDGDRAAFLVDAFGASNIKLVGFDFQDATGEKLEKLRWARRLLRVLSEERGEPLV